jgi:hypothetical protein
MCARYVQGLRDHFLLRGGPLARGVAVSGSSRQECLGYLTRKSFRTREYEFEQK